MSMPSVLFLDDNPARQKRFLRHCPHGTVVGDAGACLYMMADRLVGGPWDLVFLDHDLGEVENDDPSGSNTGSEVVRWIVANRPTIGRIICHTLSDHGPAMRDALLAAGYDVECIGFMSLIHRFDEVLNANVRERTAP